MELIKEAVSKAKASRERPPADIDGAASRHPQGGHRLPPAPASEIAWTPPRMPLDSTHLEQHRIVSFAAEDPSHVAFNILRTKIYKLLRDNRSQTLAITSPTPGCGKTVVAVNLAFSLARQAGGKTVIVDLDLKKGALARAIGVSTKGSTGKYLEGSAAFEDCFVQVADNLTVGLNSTAIRDSAELLHGSRVQELLREVRTRLAPDIVIFDLPPMLPSDDAIAFLPKVDCALLVTAAAKTTAAEIDECERQIQAATSFLGIVLNKVQGVPTNYYLHLDEYHD